MTWDRARRHLMLSKTEWYLGHHFGRDLITAQTGWILETHGVQHCWDSVEQCYNLPTMGAVLGQIDAMPYRDQVQWLATLFHQHGMKYELLEDEGGFRFDTKPCGSGGRLIEEGAYAEPKNLPMVKGPTVESFGVEDAGLLHALPGHQQVRAGERRPLLPARRAGHQGRPHHRALPVQHLQVRGRRPAGRLRPGGRQAPEPAGGSAMSAVNQRWMAWGGIVSMVILLIGMWVIAGFVPPPGPNKSMQEIVQIYVDRNTRIKFGIIVAGAGVTLLAPWSAAISIDAPHRGRARAAGIEPGAAGRDAAGRVLHPLHHVGGRRVPA